MNLSLPVIVVIAMAGVPFGYMLADRMPPYIRHSGEILPTDPAECNLPPGPDLGKITAGSCVVVKWNITVLRDCEIANSEHVGRQITDINGTHDLPKSRNVYGGDSGKKIENPLLRPFILPEWSVEGPAEYWSEARFNCNYLQKAFPSQAILINKPMIQYHVEASTAGR
jgi:hypothetical protein